MNSETWRDIPGLPRYQASNLGRIRSWCLVGRQQNGLAAEPRVLTQTFSGGSKDQYAVVTAHVGKQQKGALVHQLVLLAFHGPRPSGMQGCHCDGNSSNNRADNLRWDTTRANRADTRRHGRQPEGEKTWNHRLTAQSIVSIREARAAGRELKDIAAQFHTTFQQVYAICTGRTWRSVGGTIEPPRVRRPRH